MSSYFCGKVLSDAKENNPAFDFSDVEARMLRLKGLPVQVEHQDKIKVGEILHEWMDNRNHKWVIGKMKLDSYQAHFAHHGMRPSSKGHVLYNGLSLQHHVYRDSDGNRIKIPIEVSICREPRREGCLVSDVGCMDKTARTEYKYRASKGISHSMTSTEPAAPAKEETVPQQQPVESNQDQYKLDKGELMRQFVQTADQNEAFKNELETLKKALAEKDAELKARVEAEMAAEKAENVAKAEAMLKAYESTLTDDELTSNHREAIMHLASKYPKETKAMFEVSCLASKKAAAQIESAKSNEELNLEKRVVDVITKKRVAAPESVKEVHAASKKQRRNPYSFMSSSSSSSSSSSMKESNIDLFRALSKIKGGAHSHMERLASYQNNIRN